MVWALIFALAALVFAAMVLLGRLPSGARELTGAALLVGLAGYAWQGSPQLKGATRDARSLATPFDTELADRRNALGNRFGSGAQWLTLSDGLGRQGDTQGAANVLVSALKAEPKNPDLWIGMGNALFTHAGNMLTPAADYSYRQALSLAPDATAPAYFYGLALARSGQLQDSLRYWGPLYLRLPDKAPLKAELGRDLAQIRMILTRRNAPAGPQ